MKIITILFLVLFAVTVQAEEADTQGSASQPQSQAQTQTPAQAVTQTQQPQTPEQATQQTLPPSQQVDTAGSAPSVTTPLSSVEQKKREDIDNEITNARLRASTGAKSLVSLQSALNYNGGSIQTPFAEQRPQLSPGVVENDPAKLTGAVAVKYRASDHDNLNVGIGVGWLTPTYAGQRGQVEDPYVAYGRLFKWGNVQNVLNVQMTKYTADSSVAQGLDFESDIDHTFLVSVGKTKWQLGIDIAWTREFYSYQTTGIQDELAAYPFAEYEFNKTFSFRTVYRGLTYFNSTTDAGTFQHDDPTQSLGLGISVTRDIYFYPNVQWVWTDIRSEKTNVALAAYINM